MKTLWTVAGAFGSGLLAGWIIKGWLERSIFSALKITILVERSSQPKLAHALRLWHDCGRTLKIEGDHLECSGCGTRRYVPDARELFTALSKTSRDGQIRVIRRYEYYLGDPPRALEIHIKRREDQKEVRASA